MLALCLLTTRLYQALEKSARRVNGAYRDGFLLRKAAWNGTSRAPSPPS